MAGWRKLNAALHRDLGYLCTALVMAYCLSGLALNHIDDWNPDFIITRVPVRLDRAYSPAEINDEVVAGFGALVGESRYIVYDAPTENQVKIYYDNATLHLRLADGEGVYEKVSRRPIFYHSNVLHRNSVAGWKWVSDVLAILLILINVTGLLILRGKYGISGRGKWLIAVGMVPPMVAILLHELG